ncbi:MAG: thioredoxin domain-containing protein [Acidobacteriota bacterium]
MSGWQRPPGGSSSLSIRAQKIGGSLFILFLAGCGQTAPASSPVGLEGQAAAAASPNGPDQADPEGGAVDEVTGILPGATPFPRALEEQLDAARRLRGSGYRPRTRHLRGNGWAMYTNRLFLSSSPYLLQHAHNPVNWYPWGDEAFETARKLGRPVLLSVGYSTCHWCHVMEEESFEDLEIARVMNENYVAIKVDREERPDVDSIYMSAVQAMTGSGGWPMTVWLTPDRKPFYGGTYFPPRDGVRGAQTGFLTLLVKLKELYDQQPQRVMQASTQLTQAIQMRLAGGEQGSRMPGVAVLRNAMEFYEQHFDPVHGGLQGQHKFPSSLPVRFLLRYHRRTQDPKALKMSVLTLEKMAAGGIYDQVGGGFHRYSTDPQWLIPHFEKMLYDNALLVSAYLDGYQATGREDFARIAREILRYVQRDMTSPQGAFYSATDADSLGPDGHLEEGYYFTWTPEELVKVLGADRARIVSAFYGVTPAGNFEGRNLLHVPRPLRAVARGLDLPPEKLRSIIEKAREALYRARSKRQAPLRDEKILTAWNGLMISGFARAALVLDDPDDARIAARAASFVLGNLRQGGRLRRSFKDGRAEHNAYLEDYAFLVAGLLDLFEATSEKQWLEEAIALDRVLHQQYEDTGGGGFFMTSKDHESLLAREKPAYDGAEPSGNSVAVLNLLRLHEFTTDDRYRQRAEEALQSFQGILVRQPSALSEMLLAVDFQTDTPKEVIIVQDGTPGQAASLLAELRTTFLPNRVLAVVREGAEQEALASLVPLVEGKTAQNGEATAYVCEERVCKLPTRSPEVFARQIRSVKPLDPPAPAPKN